MKSFRKTCKKACLALTVLLLLGAGKAQADEHPLNVVASFSILGDLAQTIGGDAVKVKTLVGPDGDVHAYQPTPDAAKAVATADILLINGLGLEAGMNRLVGASGTKALLLVASAGVKARTMEEKGGKIPDPHAWQDPRNGALYIRNIAAAFERARPEKAAEIAERAKKLETECLALDAKIRKELEEIPPERRKIITSHDAFGYLGAAYGINVLAPQGLSTESEVESRDLQTLIRQIREEKIKTLFIENMTDPRLIEQIAKDTGAKMGGELYSDALSPANGPAPHYLDMFRNNIPKMLAAMKE